MEILAYTVGIGGALFGIGIAIWHEFKWLGRRSWTHTNGRVIEIVRFESNQASNYRPKIEFIHRGSRNVFTSEYGVSGLPEVGTIVPVIYDPLTREAEHFSYVNRWLFTIGPGALGLFFLWIGISASIANAAQDSGGLPTSELRSNAE